MESFYELSAAHQYPAAWALADPTFQAQVGGYASYQAGQSADVAIHFSSARQVAGNGNSATVAVTTTSVQTRRTYHCAGTVDLARGAHGWLLHLIHINCT